MEEVSLEKGEHMLFIDQVDARQSKVISPVLACVLDVGR
jgi:hypothetical protein